jgi:hypothetical protein
MTIYLAYYHLFDAEMIYLAFSLIKFDCFSLFVDGMMDFVAINFKEEADKK